MEQGFWEKGKSRIKRFWDKNLLKNLTNLLETVILRLDCFTFQIKTKMRYSKLWLFGLALTTVFVSMTSAALVRFDSIWQVGSSDISHIHFAAGGNDFGGLLVWQQTSNATSSNNKQDIKIDGTNDVIFCSRQVKGLYYNSQRGERLRPLDVETAKALWFDTHSSLSMTGGVFTSCTTTGTSVEEADPYGMGIYGKLTHTFNGREYILLAGAQYQTNFATKQNAVKSAPVAPTLQRFDNKIPIGLLYDYNGGVGLVGCTLDPLSGLDQMVNLLNTGGVNDIFAYDNDWIPVLTWTFASLNSSLKLDCSNAGITLDQLLILKIQGLIGMSTDSMTSDGMNIANLGGNEADSKTQYFSSVNVNNATLINQARKTAEELCKGKWSQSYDTSPEVICWEGNNSTRSLNPSVIGNKTLIVRNGTIVLERPMTSTSSPLNIFIDGGRLLLQQGAGSSYIQGFDEKWYPTTTSPKYEWMFLKGNFIINGLIGYLTTQTNYSSIQYKVFIHGKFTSLNTYTYPSEARSIQVADVLNRTSVPTERIDLQAVFSWRCNYGSWSDGSACPLGEFQNAPLIIINQNYPSRLVD